MRLKITVEIDHAIENIHVQLRTHDPQANIDARLSTQLEGKIGWIINLPVANVCSPLYTALYKSGK